MTKQEKIKEAWIKLGIIKGVEEFCDNDGFVDVNYLHKKDINNLLEFKKHSELENNLELMLCRPKSLQGIKDNNGWNDINGYLPCETECHFYDIKNNDYWTAMIDKYGNFPYETKATHFQPIDKPNPPLY